MQIKISKSPQDYQPSVDYMEQKVASIIAGEADEEIWFLEHKEVYTAGTSSNEDDLIEKDKFPVIKTGRGGQYTYHGAGQLICYLMLNLKNHYQPPDLKQFVCDIEQAIIDTLAEYGVESFRRSGRVGIWVFDKYGKECKIAAIGIRVRKWTSFHGFSINLNPALENFSGIVPCGIQEFGVTSLDNLSITFTKASFIKSLLKNLKYTQN